MSSLCSLSLPTGDHEEINVLCDKALDYLEAGLTMIKTHFQSASLEEQEAIIEETEQMLMMMTVALNRISPGHSFGRWKSRWSCECRYCQ